MIFPDAQPLHMLHSMSYASATAVARLLTREGVQVSRELFTSIGAFIEKARLNLCLENSALSACIMFVQPLMQVWKQNWKFALTVALSLGTKFVTEGFFLSDITERLTDEFSVTQLRYGESKALEMYDWGWMRERLRSFRNALVTVALEQASSKHVYVPSSCHEESVLHVLLVDDDKLICKVHKEYVLSVQPNARIKVCTGAEKATRYWDKCVQRNDLVHLVLLDFNLTDTTCNLSSLRTQTWMEAIMTNTNGLNVSDALGRIDSDTYEPPKSLVFKPLIVLITAHAAELLTVVPAHDDAPIKSCDIVIPKPLSREMTCVLVESCTV